MLGCVCQGDLTLIPPWTNGARLAPSVCAKCFERVPKFLNDPRVLQRRMQSVSFPKLSFVNQFPVKSKLFAINITRII